MNGLKRIVIWTTGLTAISAAILIACNVEWSQVNNPPWIDNIDFDSGENEDVADLISEGIGRWNTCTGMGTDFPQLGEGTGDVTVQFVDNGPLGSLPDSCSDFDPSGGSSIEGTLTLWAWSKTTNGTPIQCNLESSITHEMGHVLGYADSPCADHVMSGLKQEHLDTFIPRPGYPGGGYWTVKDRTPKVNGECNFLASNLWDGQDPPDDPPPCCTPLVLDRDMDGLIATTSVENAAVWFDLDGDGVKELTGWTNPSQEEAFLWIDLNVNGIVDGGQELFGDASVLPGGVVGEDGFMALATYDDPGFGGNGDGTIDALDAVWSRLLLWIDRSHDGVTDPGEIALVAGSDITAISLDHLHVSEYDGVGNFHATRGSYWSTRGLGGHLRAHVVEDVVFRVR